MSLILGAGGIAVGADPNVFVMHDGAALFEAESAVESTSTGDWWTLDNKTPGSTGTGSLKFVMEDLWEKLWLDPIEQSQYAYPQAVFRYQVHVPEAGDYEVRLRNRHVKKDGDNDAWVAVNDSRFIKIWDHHPEEWGWDDRAQTYSFKEGVNEVVLAGRSAGFMVDRIAVIQPGLQESQWADKRLPTSAVHGIDGDADTFLPRQIWVETDGHVVIEAENLDHHEAWSLLTEPAGFTGSGYLEWNGPRAPGSGNDDYTGARHHPQNTHLILRVLVSNPGVYRLDARNIHEREDGDNDAWIGELGLMPETDWPIKRIGDSHKDGKGFTWADWGNRLFPLKRGLNTLYLGGRSPGFGIDRIALWSVDMPGAEETARDLSTVQSNWMTDPHAGPALLDSPFTLVHAEEFEKVTSNLVVYGSDHSMIGLEAGSETGDVGRLMMEFPGQDGEYTVRLIHLSEASASAHYTVTIGGKTALEFFGHETSSPEFVSERSGILSLQKGDPVVVEIRPNGTAHGRFRALSIHALDNRQSLIGAQSSTPAIEAFSADSAAAHSNEKPVPETGPTWHAPDAPVFVESNGLVKMEAESLAGQADNFTLMTTPAGFSGTGYLRWDGSGHSQGSRHEGEAEVRDGTFIPANERLTFQFEIKTPGKYRFQIHNIHVREDGDNDCWISFPETDPVWHKVGSKHPGEYDWQSWSYKFEESKGEGEPGHRYTTLEPGIHYLYLAGRSHGFGVDFVAIHTIEYEDTLQEIIHAPESARQ